MSYKFMVIFVLCVISASSICGKDKFFNFIETKLEELPTWIHENLTDELHFVSLGFSRHNAFIKYDIKPSIVKAFGLKNTQISYGPSVYGSLYSGHVGVAVGPTFVLQLEENYIIKGHLFPDIDQIPFRSSGVWSFNVTMSHQVNYLMKFQVSANGTISSNAGFIQDYGLSGYDMIEIVPDVFFTNHPNQWYDQIVQQGIEDDIMEIMMTDLRKNLNVFDKFFIQTFQNMNYFDM